MVYGNTGIKMERKERKKYDGLWTKWSENGEKTVETWVDGTQGLSWYENGKKKEEGNYKYISVGEGWSMDLLG